MESYKSTTQIIVYELEASFNVGFLVSEQLHAYHLQRWKGGFNNFLLSVRGCQLADTRNRAKCEDSKQSAKAIADVISM